jgi:hypothetical protein
LNGWYYQPIGWHYQLILKDEPPGWDRWNSQVPAKYPLPYLRVPFFHNAGNSDFSASRQCSELWLIAIFRANGITGWRRHQPVFGKPDFVFQRRSWRCLSTARLRTRLRRGKLLLARPAFA